MTTIQKNIPVDVVHLLPRIDDLLMKLLYSLQPCDWEKCTVAKQWSVKDVVAHLLDGNIRVLSMLRDGYVGEHPDIQSKQDLLDFLNGLNADWVKAMKRVSPAMLVLLHKTTGHLFGEYYASLDPFGKSPFSVAWAGESESKNWMHIAREYTEKWLHQQQIRAAIDDYSLMTKELFYPFIDIFMLALPHTYRAVIAEEGTLIRLTIPGEAGGSWNLLRTSHDWILDKLNPNQPASEVIIDANVAWCLFSKSTRPADIKEGISITGNEELGKVALTMISVMA